MMFNSTILLHKNAWKDRKSTKKFPIVVQFEKDNWQMLLSTSVGKDVNEGFWGKGCCR